jgi:hypothetical protein
VTRGIRNRNPGNIRAGQGFLGEAGADKDGYAIFKDEMYGIRAIAVDLLTKFRKRGLVTIRAIISRYAPPNENDTQAYIDAVARDMKRGPDDELTLTNVAQLVGMVRAIIVHENGFCPYRETLIDVACRLALGGSSRTGENTA